MQYFELDIVVTSPHQSPEQGVPHITPNRPPESLVLMSSIYSYTYQVLLAFQQIVIYKLLTVSFA